jgi:hypothetical protein
MGPGHAARNLPSGAERVNVDPTVL